MIVGDYSLDGYFTASSKDNYKDADFKITQNYTFVARPMWKKESTFYFTEIDLSGLDYEHDTPYDYSTPIIESIINPHFKDVDFILRIYGEAYTPSVMINNNVYEVDVDLAEGEFLEINSANKTIIKRNIYGVDINQFSNRNRDYYIFQKIAPGYNTIVWDGSFSFTITLLEERSEPVWI